ncbi:hypothetical protein XM264_1598 [Enterococcus faecalis]|nr:hypothetical protein XM264_1598 [Enterococcus faecalis]
MLLLLFSKYHPQKFQRRSCLSTLLIVRLFPYQSDKPNFHPIHLRWHTGQT